VFLAYELNTAVLHVDTQQNGMVTAQVLEKWLTAFNRRMTKRNCRFCTVTCHPHLELSNSSYTRAYMVPSHH